MPGHKQWVGCMAWSHHTLATGSGDKSVLLRDVRAPEPVVGRLGAHRSEVCGLKWSPDDRELASGGNDNQLMVWTPAAASAPPLHRFPAPPAALQALAWSPPPPGLLARRGGARGPPPPGRDAPPRGGAGAGVLGEHVGDQAVLGVVGHPDALVLVLEHHDRRHRAEDLVGGQGRTVENVAHDVRRDEGTQVRDRRRRGGHDALADRLLEELQDLVALLDRDHGTEIVARIDTGAHLEAGEGLLGPAGELLGQRLVHVEPVGRGARGTAVAHLRDHRAGHGIVDIGTQIGRAPV